MHECMQQHAWILHVWCLNWKNFQIIKMYKIKILFEIVFIVIIAFLLDFYFLCGFCAFPRTGWGRKTARPSVPRVLHSFGSGVQVIDCTHPRSAATLPAPVRQLQKTKASRRFSRLQLLHRWKKKTKQLSSLWYLLYNIDCKELISNQIVLDLCFHV